MKKKCIKLPATTKAIPAVKIKIYNKSQLSPEKASRAFKQKCKLSGI